MVELNLCVKMYGYFVCVAMVKCLIKAHFVVTFVAKKNAFKYIEKDKIAGVEIKRYLK